jgi:lipopolysaccharide export LptBFGC system permease protein LptF
MKIFFIFVINEIKTSLENFSATNTILKNKKDELIFNNGRYEKMNDQSPSDEICFVLCHEDFKTSETITDYTMIPVSETGNMTKTKKSSFELIEKTPDTFTDLDKNILRKRNPSFLEYFIIFNGKMVSSCVVLIFILISLAFYYYKKGNHKKTWTSLLAIGIIPMMIIIGTIISGRKNLKALK